MLVIRLCTRSMSWLNRQPFSKSTSRVHEQAFIAHIRIRLVVLEQVFRVPTGQRERTKACFKVHPPSSALICCIGGASSSEYSGSDSASGLVMTARRSTRALPSHPLLSRGLAFSAIPLDSSLVIGEFMAGSASLGSIVTVTTMCFPRWCGVGEPKPRGIYIIFTSRFATALLDNEFKALVRDISRANDHN